METIGQRISRLREKRGMTQPELAKKLGVKPGHISNWEHDKHVPKAGNLINLAVALRTTGKYLLTGKGPESDSSELAGEIGQQVAKLHDDFLSLLPENRFAVLALAQALKSTQSPDKNE
jgi:transcriptional regulator with XRE-family HTH domain